jgi:hypothetical protein
VIRYGRYVCIFSAEMYFFVSRVKHTCLFMPLYLFIKWKMSLFGIIILISWHKFCDF